MRYLLKQACCACAGYVHVRTSGDVVICCGGRGRAGQPGSYFLTYSSRVGVREAERRRTKSPMARAVPYTPHASTMSLIVVSFASTAGMSASHMHCSAATRVGGGSGVRFVVLAAR